MPVAHQCAGISQCSLMKLYRICDLAVFSRASSNFVMFPLRFFWNPHSVPIVQAPKLWVAPRTGRDIVLLHATDHRRPAAECFVGDLLRGHPGPDPRKDPGAGQECFPDHNLSVTLPALTDQSVDPGPVQMVHPRQRVQRDPLLPVQVP